MKAKAFAEKYVGQEVKVDGYVVYNGLIGRVVGYDSDGNNYLDRVIIQQSSHKEGFSIINSNGTTIILDNPTRRNDKCMGFQPGYLSVISTSNLPDNCDDCGAVGNEVCKEGCPNK